MRLTQLKMDWRVVTVIITSTLILTIESYNNLFKNTHLDSFFFYLVLPLIIIRVVLRESPAEYGFCLGDWKAGLALTAVGILGISLVVPFVAHSEDFHSYYSKIPKDLLPLILNIGVELVGWEFFFRGFLLFSLFRIAGPHAIWLQAVPFTVVHFGKPELETLSCIFSGSAFGYVAWRTRSFLYPFLIHTYLAVFIIFLS